MHAQQQRPSILQSVRQSRLQDPLKAEQQQMIQKQQTKQDQLKEKKHQLDVSLMNLNHTSKVCKQLIHLIHSQPNRPAEHQLIQNKRDSLNQFLQKLENITQKLTQAHQQKMEIEQQIITITRNQINLKAHMGTFRVHEKDLDGKLALYQQLLKQLRGEIDQIQSRIKDRHHIPFLQDSITELVTELISLHPGQISQDYISSLRQLQLGALSHSIIQEIEEKQAQLQELKSCLFSLKDKHFQLEQATKGKDQLYQQLQNNQKMNYRYLQDLQDITNFNDYLHNNMASQVDREVNERIQALNESNYLQVSKYLKASEYLLQKFGSILNNQELIETLSQLNSLKQQANQKNNQHD